MKILITGGKGYLGSALTKAFSKEHEVISIGREDVDLTNPYSVHSFFLLHGPFNIVLHCANEGKNPRDLNWKNGEKNLIMFFNLLNNEINFDRFINFGTGAEFDEELNQLPYGLSKKFISQSILNHNKFFNIRLWGLFDENEKDARFIKGNILRYINKQPMIIYENKLMDFFYMQDLIKVVNYYLNQNKPPKEINCCYDKIILSLKNIANIINNLDEHKVEIIVENQTNIPYKSDNNLGLDLNFVGLEQGIKEVYEKLKNEYKN